MRRIGRGEFFRTAHVNGPTEVGELARSFNRMAVELEHLDRLKADFTAHVSHELRTPLTAIREGTALLLEGISGPLTKDQSEILEVVRNHSQRLFQSISSILDLSKDGGRDDGLRIHHVRLETINQQGHRIRGSDCTKTRH